MQPAGFVTRVARIACAVAATAAGLVLAFLERIPDLPPGISYAAFVLRGIGAGAAMLVFMSLLAWYVVLPVAAAAAIVLFALPMRISRLELGIWALYAALLGPAFSAFDQYSERTAVAPPGSHRECYRDSHERPPAEVCLFVQSFGSPKPAPTVTPRSGGTAIPELWHPTPIPNP